MNMRLHGELKAFIGAASFLSLAMGCSSVPEALRVESDYPGAFWTVVDAEGPCRVAGEWTERIGETNVTRRLESQVWFVDMMLEGWGTALPWCWFARDRACQYVVEWRMESSNGEESRGERAVHSGEPIPDALMSPRIVADRIIGSAGDEWHGMPIFDATRFGPARDRLLASRNR
jgi:hypothetical protein